MSVEKLREEFESWISGDWQGARLTRNPDNAAMFVGQYQEDRVHMAWKAWQASRAALVIELPPEPSIPEDPEEAIDDSHMDAYHSAIGMRNACAKSIEAAGVKCK